MVRVEGGRDAEVEVKSEGCVDSHNVRRRVRGRPCGHVRIIHDDEISAVKFRRKKVSTVVGRPQRPLLIVAIEVTQDDGVGGEERRNRSIVALRAGSGGRNVDVGDVEINTGDVSVDDDGFDDAVVDWRGGFREAKGVMNEGKQAAAAAAALTISPDNGEIGKGGQTRAISQLGLLDARDDNIVFG